MRERPIEDGLPMERVREKVKHLQGRWWRPEKRTGGGARETCKTITDEWKLRKSSRSIHRLSKRKAVGEASSMHENQISFGIIVINAVWLDKFVIRFSFLRINSFDKTNRCSPIERTR
jgi:hypothetical protein